MLREYIWLACAHMRLGRSVCPMMVTPCSHDGLAGLGQLAVALLLGGQIDDDAARLHRLAPSPR